MNCVVICCDTFRADMLTRADVSTPNLDRLAAEGILFTQAFAEGLPTIQARRSLFTGTRCFPWRFGLESRGLSPFIPGWHRIPDSQTSLAEHFFTKGIVCGLVADTYHMFKPSQNFTRGFSSWSFIRGQEQDPMRSGPLSQVDIRPHLPEGVEVGGFAATLTQYKLNMLDRVCEEDYLPARVFRRAAEWVDENMENGPWFLWVDSFAPHERWDPPAAYADAYAPCTTGKEFIQPQVINRIHPCRADIERTKALYLGYVTFVDRWIGHLVGRLEERGLLGETVICFTSDHGTQLWDHGAFGKGGTNLRAYNTQVPLIVRRPGEPQPGSRREDLVQHFDLFPTICAMMGVASDVEQDVAGRDLFAASVCPPEKVITAWGGQVAVRDSRWNLVLDSTCAGGGEAILYDLAADPHEDVNVAEAHPEVVAAFRDHLESTIAPLPIPMNCCFDRRQAPPTIAHMKR